MCGLELEILALARSTTLALGAGMLRFKEDYHDCDVIIMVQQLLSTGC